MKKRYLLLPAVLAGGAAARAYWMLTPHPARPDRGKIRVACLGDSITFGSGVRKTRKTDCWTAVLERLLGSRCQVINYGVSGAALQEESDKPYRKRGFLQKVQAAQPQYILLMLGTNDSKPHNWDAGRFDAEYRSFVAELMAYPWPHKVILMTSPRAFPDAKTGAVGYSIDSAPLSGEIRSTVLGAAKENNLACIDLYALTQDHPEYFGDGVHPNKAGNRAIAEHIYAAGLIG